MRNHKIILPAVVLAVAALLILALNIALAQGGGNPTDIVISEVMFNAVNESGAGYGEWVEIYNKGSATVDISGWLIRDNHITKTITTTMCPNNSCEIPPGECWLIAWNQDYLQAEFNNYTSPLSPTVQTTSTIFLDDEIGDGLNNSSDMVALLIASGGVTLAVDCISWGASNPPNCSSLSYVSGGGGADTDLYNEGNGQSIANIQGTWYYHQPNASPYNCINIAEGGDPTAVVVAAFGASSVPLWPVAAGLPLAGLALLLAVAEARRRN